MSIHVIVMEFLKGDNSIWNTRDVLEKRFPGFLFKVSLIVDQNETKNAIFVRLPLEQVQEVQSFAFTLRRTA